MRFVPFGIAIAFFGGMLAAIVFSVMPEIGRFNYALDDAYIHLAVARNLVETGWFGVRAGEFVLLSSSPIYTLALALLMRLGMREMAPLFLASAGAIFALFVSHKWLADLSAIRRTFSLLALGVVSMLAPLVVLGLEHT